MAKTRPGENWTMTVNVVDVWVSGGGTCTRPLSVSFLFRASKKVNLTVKPARLGTYSRYVHMSLALRPQDGIQTHSQD